VPQRHGNQIRQSWEVPNAGTSDRRERAALAAAFPADLRADVITVVDAMPPGQFAAAKPFTLSIDGEVVAIPERIYNAPLPDSAVERLSVSQQSIAHCLYSRHHSGYVRQASIERVRAVDRVWVAPFVVRLLGEYVIEIVDVIGEALATFSHLSTHRRFAAENPRFMRRTAAQATSYWNCYYREYGRSPDLHEIEELVRLNPDYRYQRFQKAADYPAAAALALLDQPSSAMQRQRTPRDT